MCNRVRMQQANKEETGETGTGGKEKEGSARLIYWDDPVVGGIYEGMETTSEERRMSAKDFCGVISRPGSGLDLGANDRIRQIESDEKCLCAGMWPDEGTVELVGKTVGLARRVSCKE